jgi:hypothetical protein
MKKVAVLLAALAISTGVIAEPPTKEINWFGSAGYENDSEAEENTGIRRDKSAGAPIAPATLLLLGLGGAAVGTKVVRNRRKE